MALASASRIIQPGRKIFRVLTASIRVLPDFIIIGAQRSGTTSLYSYLVAHPGVAPAFKKEVHFFDLNFRKGVGWYRGHFPTRVYRRWAERIRKHRILSGEATPYYLFHPHAPRRTFELVPRVRLLALLRNPVDRAYSHYQHERRRGRETLSFEEALAREAERLNGEMRRLLADEDYDSFNHRHYSYLSRGIYIEQVRAWTALFPREQMLILKSEDLFDDPERVMKQVYDFLELPPWAPAKWEKYHVEQYPEMDASMRGRLLEYFRLHNEKLSQYLGVNFDWE